MLPEIPPGHEVLDEIYELGSTEPVAYVTRCRHDRKEPVDLLSGEVVAQLCLDCDAQLPPPGQPMPLQIEEPRFDYQ